MLQPAHFSWVGRGWSRWSRLSEWICLRTMWWDAATHVGRPRDSRRGPPCQERFFSRAADGKKIVGLVQSFLREPVAIYACWMQQSKQKMQRWARNISLNKWLCSWRFGQSCLVVVFDQEWLANVHPFPIISTIIWFSGLGRHQPCWRQRWRHCYRSTSQRLVHSLCHMQSETHLMVPFPFRLLKSRCSLLTRWGRFNLNIVAWLNVASSSSMERTLQTLKYLNKVTEEKLLKYCGKLRNKKFVLFNWIKKLKMLYTNLTLWIRTVYLESDLVE